EVGQIGEAVEAVVGRNRVAVVGDFIEAVVEARLEAVVAVDPGQVVYQLHLADVAALREVGGGADRGAAAVAGAHGFRHQRQSFFFARVAEVRGVPGTGPDEIVHQGRRDDAGQGQLAGVRRLGALLV